ncbi:phosphatase PAP2 family protein [Actinoplanes sp. NPDC051343]|uniref:phosphatase PAP2 family protein n=1 Tax=Actinoplanes sp. NPDC051343 TaxID=3363906 RepID=UPI0037912DDF
MSRKWWLIDLLLVAAFAALTAVLINGHLLVWDQQVADWAFAHQPAPIYWTARVLNYLGQGGQLLMPVSIILTAWLTWRTRSVRAIFPFVAAFLLTYITIGPLKIWADRAAPRFQGPDKTEMFNPHATGAAAMSYPSGHMGNSLVWYGVIALLVATLLGRPLTGREWFLIRVLPVAILFATTIYTGFHWLTDSIAGVLLGLFLTRLIDRIPWDSIPLGFLPRWNGPIRAIPRPASRV